MGQRLPRRVRAPGDHHRAPGRGPGGRPGGGVRRARATAAWRLAGARGDVASLCDADAAIKACAAACGSVGVAAECRARRAPPAPCAAPPVRARPRARRGPCSPRAHRRRRNRAGLAGPSRRRPMGPGPWGPAVRATGPSARWADRPPATRRTMRPPTQRLSHTQQRGAGSRTRGPLPEREFEVSPSGSLLRRGRPLTNQESVLDPVHLHTRSALPAQSGRPKQLSQHLGSGSPRNLKTKSEPPDFLLHTGRSPTPAPRPPGPPHTHWGRAPRCPSPSPSRGLLLPKSSATW